MEWLETILKDLENKDALVSAIKKELPKNFIPKTEFNEKNEELKSTKAKMDELQGKVTELSNNTEQTAEVKAQLEALKGEYESFKADADTRVKTIQVKQSIERNLVKANANPDTIDLLVNQFDVSKLQIDSKGEIVDWDVHFTPVKDARKSLFGEVNLKGEKPPMGDNVDIHNPFIKGEKFNLSEQGKIVREDTDRAKKLIQLAGLNPANYGI